MIIFIFKPQSFDWNIFVKSRRHFPQQPSREWTFPRNCRTCDFTARELSIDLEKARTSELPKTYREFYLSDRIWLTIIAEAILMFTVLSMRPKSWIEECTNDIQSESTCVSSHLRMDAIALWVRDVACYKFSVTDRIIHTELQACWNCNTYMLSAGRKLVANQNMVMCSTVWTMESRKQWWLSRCQAVRL